MNKAKLKTYAPQARQDFIRMIRQRADLLGLTKKEIQPAKIEGEVAVIEGREYPRSFAEAHKKLAAKVATEGAEHLIERVAYSWFNRFAALRFMEVNDFLAHGFRVLSSKDANKTEPEILTHAAEVELAGLDRAKALELKLDGNRDAELYKMLLVAQCNELSRAMPFMFEKINDETEILLPDNLLQSDSVMRKMVGELGEDNWRDAATGEPIVEVIGWLYQFYISEKKDEVIGKTVKSEDIPAATQLFTPNWIVKYMTQNSLGRLWLENNPHSQLAQAMEFYIKPAEENSALSTQHSALNPEELRILDPACGSGHILVEAYELLKAIYTERGYSSRDIPLLILEKNLFGLDIDERAAQMASFALLMKARRDDRRIFEKLSSVSSPSSPTEDKSDDEGQRTKDKRQIPNVLTVPDSSQLPYRAREIAEMFFSRDAQQTSAAIPIRADGDFLFDEMQTQPSLMLAATDQTPIANRQSEIEVSETNVEDLLSLFEQGKTLGSLIRIPHGFARVVERLEKAIQAKREGGNFLEQIAARELEPFVRAARLLANKYDAVIANPPYMGTKYYNAELKTFAVKNFPDSKSDLYAMFIERGFEFAKKDGFNAMVTMQSWMLQSSYENFRENLLENHTIITLLHLPYDGKGPTAMGISFGISVSIFKNKKKDKYLSHFSCSRYFELDSTGVPKQFPTVNERLRLIDIDDLKEIPGSLIAYWISDKAKDVFSDAVTIREVGHPCSGIQTGNNEKFLRQWFEVNLNKVGFGFNNRKEAVDSGLKWFPHKKGGDFRRWYGNCDFIMDWENDGFEIQRNPSARPQNLSYMFKEGVTWSHSSSGTFSARFSQDGFTFNVEGPTFFSNDPYIFLGYFCSKVVLYYMELVSSTLHFLVGNVADLPFNEKTISNNKVRLNEIVKELVEIARADWDSFETSWDFHRLPMVECARRNETNSVEECWQTWKNLCDERIQRMQTLETENNRLFIEAYGLEDELSPEVPLEQITLACADAEKDTRRLLSYFIGCLMGRYSLDSPGLIYADAGNKGFDPTRYLSFPADDDGIVPVTDTEWFPQEAARQFEKFIAVAFAGEREKGEGIREESKAISSLTPNPSSLSPNLKWIAEQLGAKASETPIETVRRYFSSSFFKDHLQTYKKRPIYWLFSSGKQKAFECLVYLHRYSESTLPRMRHEYVLPLMNKLVAQIETLDGLIGEAQSTAERTKLEKQRETYTKKQTELASFDEKLRHAADLKITLDLDDGVKANYGKFGDLLAEVKQVAATKE